MNTTIVVRKLSPTQTEPWEFVLATSESAKGGVVSVPSTMAGYPIDWPPRIPEQVGWLNELVPSMTPCAGHAWRLKARAWKRLCDRLNEQVEFERTS